MARMPGLLRSRQKVAEVELDQSLMAARLADIFGVGSMTDVAKPTPGEAPAEGVEGGQPDVASQPRDTVAAVGAKRRGGSRPAIVIMPAPDLGGATPEPGEPGLADRREPRRPALVGVMAEPGPRSAARPGDAWWSGDVHDVLSTDFGTGDPGLPDARPHHVADAPGAPDLALDPGRAGALVADPQRIDTAKSTDIAVDARRATRAKTKRRTVEPAPRPAGQSRGTSPRRASAGRATSAAAKHRQAAAAASCPYCALLLEPPPTSSRGCPGCRQRIVVKRIDGRTVYLTEAAVIFFDAERRRIASSKRWIRERERWLKLAAAAGAPPDRAARLAAAHLSEASVEAARSLYMTTVERAFRSARRERRWEDASRIRRDQAVTLLRLAGSPLTPPKALVTLHRDGVAVELRGIAEIARDAELVSATCCDVCRADDGRICRISHELLVPRLPHLGCPKGLCKCRWDLTARDRTILRRYHRRPARLNQPGVPTGPEPTV